MHKDWERAESVLKSGGLAVVPTDTLYGILGDALDKKVVERIYQVRGRDKNKPCIVLISDILDLKKFGVVLDNDKKLFLDKVWPKSVSVILPISDRFLKKFIYLHKGKNSLAFRMIGRKNKNLFNILQNLGPMVAPSANPQGLQPAKNRKQARLYFGKTIDSYVCSGTKNSAPSTIVDYTKNKPKIVRQGKVKIIF